MKMLLNECKIEMIRIFRNPYFVFWSLFMPILFYFIFTKVVNTGMDDQDLWNKHFLMSIAIFSVMGSAIMTLGIRMVQERNEGWTTWIKVTPLPSSSYFISKMVGQSRSEEHTSELQSRENLVCRLLLEKKKNIQRS